MIRRTSKQPSGIAVIIALIFMMAFLSISTTIAQIAMYGLRSTQDAYKSDQAKYNAKSAVEEALYYYHHPEELPSDMSLTSAVTNDTTGTKIAQWRIVNVSGGDQGLSNEIKGYKVYPFPGTGTAGKNCDVYNQMLKEDDIKAAYGDLPGYLKHPGDYPCNWNKIRSFDSAVEIPLYATAPNGEKVWLKFDEIQIRVRTACDEANFSEEQKGKTVNEEKAFYEKTGMCKKDKRYEMYFNGDASNPTVKEILKNTVLNWGIYSDKGDTNYLIPIKDLNKFDDTKNSNIHTLAINTANSDFPEKGDFVVLDGNTKALPGFPMAFPLMINALNQSSADLSKPQISNSILRLTVENKFLDKDSTPMDPKYIPHLEYQILYKANPADPAITLTNPQISGEPVIIGEGYSGGFKHTIKAYIIQTKTGFDYVYQKP